MAWVVKKGATSTLALHLAWSGWKQWYFWVTHIRLLPIRKATKKIHLHIDNILTCYQHPLTKTMSKGLNS